MEIRTTQIEKNSTIHRGALHNLLDIYGSLS